MGVMRPREPAGLVRWRDASQGLVGASRASADLFTEYLISGGPDAIKSLQATIRRLQLQLEEQKADGRLERYRKLQKDLEECDKVRAALRDALVSSQWSDDEVDGYLSKKLFKASQLYGASRELLLRENRLLRCQLEEHHVTSRTSRPVAAAGAGAGGGAPGRLVVAESRLKQARMMQGPHMESVSRLLTAAEELEAAEQAYRLPSVAHAEVQADDGSRKYIQTLEQQMATLAGQKMQLMNQVASLTEQNRVLDMKLEGALDQVSELRRQKTEMLAHADNLSKDLRDHLLSEARRADVAETSLAEARLLAAAAREAEAEARRRMDAALAEAGAMQAALQEKTEQVDTLRGLYLELRETLEKLAGDVASGQQDMARRLLDATNAAAADQRTLLLDVRDAADGSQRAAAHSAVAVEDMSGVQRVLVGEMAQQREVTLGAYERQLGALMALLQQSEADRVRLARQAIAASALNRVEDKRHQKTVALLLHEVPGSVAERLAPELGALAEGTAAVADGLAKTQDTLAAAGVVVPGLVGPGPGPDLVEDETTRLLGGSRALRSQLHNLAAAAPGPPLEGAGAQTLAGQASPYAASLFRQLPPGMQPLPPVGYGPYGLTPPPPPGAVPGPSPAAMKTPAQQSQQQQLPPHHQQQQQQLMHSPPDRFAGGAVGSPGDLAVAWYPPGLVPSDSGGRGGGPPGYPAAPSYLSGRRALGMTSPNQWDDVPYIDQFQYNYQPLQQVRGGGAEQAAHVDLVLQLAPPPPPPPELLAEAEAARLLAAGEGPAGWHGTGTGIGTGMGAGGSGAVAGGPGGLPPGIGAHQAWAFEPVGGGAHVEPPPPPPAQFLSMQPLPLPAQPQPAPAEAVQAQTGRSEHPPPQHPPMAQAAPSARASGSGDAAGPAYADTTHAPATAAPTGAGAAVPPIVEPSGASRTPAHPASGAVGAPPPPPPPPSGPPPLTALSAAPAPVAPAAGAALTPTPSPPPPPPPPAPALQVEGPHRGPPSAASLAAAPAAASGPAAAAAAAAAPLTRAGPATGVGAAASKPAAGAASVAEPAGVAAPLSGAVGSSAPVGAGTGTGMAAAPVGGAHKPAVGAPSSEIEPAEEEAASRGAPAGAVAGVGGAVGGAGSVAGAGTAAPPASGLLVLPEVMELSQWKPAAALSHFAPP